MRIVVVGAGISGLAAAYRLLRLGAGRNRDIDLTVLEASSTPGGVIATRHQGPVLMEEGPDCFISTKPAGVELCEELGISSQLIPTAGAHRRSFIVKNKQLLPVPEGLYLMAPTKAWPFALSPLVSWCGKLRMGMEWFIPPRARPPGGDESLESFVLRRFGREALTWVAQPMIGGIYTAEPSQLSLRATFPQFLDMEAKHGSVLRGMLRQQDRETRSAHGAAGPRYGLFLSFKEGLQTLIDTLVERVGANRIRYGCPVTSVTQTEKAWVATTKAGERLEADAILIALPGPQTGALLGDALPAVTADLASVPYAGAATLNLLFDRHQIRHPLDGMGFVVPSVEKLSLIGCTFSNIKFEGRAPDEKRLLRAFVGGAALQDLLTRSDEHILERVLADLRDLLHIEGAPSSWYLTRHSVGLPQYPVGHLERVGRVEAAIAATRGLAVAGNAYRGVGIPDCILSANQAAAKLLSERDAGH